MQQQAPASELGIWVLWGRRERLRMDHPEKGGSDGERLMTGTKLRKERQG